MSTELLANNKVQTRYLFHTMPMIFHHILEATLQSLSLFTCIQCIL